MMRSNVIDMQEFKNFLQVRNKEEHYGRYLKTLANSQLEIEINHLLNEFSEDCYEDDFHSKGRLILEEISSRIRV